MFNQLRNYLVVQNQLNGNMYKPLSSDSASGLVWSEQLLNEHTYTEDRIDTSTAPKLRVVGGLDVNPVNDNRSDDAEAA